MSSEQVNKDAPFLRIKRVTRRFGDIFATRDVSLDIAEGQFLAMLGPSGSGKTTLLRIIAGFETATEGAIEIRGRDVSGAPPNRRNIGVVFQNLALFPHLSVFRNIAFGLEMRGVPAPEIGKRVAMTLEMVRLGGMMERLPSQLSGGQQQRVALARALVIQPDILLLDEPLSALDRDLRAEMQYEIRRIQQQLGITAVMVTHDQEEAMTMGDQIAILKDGQLSQLGTAEEIYSTPRSAFVARFMGIANLFPVDEVVPHADGAQLRLAGGFTTRSAMPAGDDGSGSFSAVIRPEEILLGEAAEAAENRYRARVKERTFLGAFSRISVDLQPGPTVNVLLPAHLRTPALNALQPGDELPIGWQTRAVMVVPS